MDDCFIYALIDIDSNQVRYIGKTINIAVRKRSHKTDKTNTHRGCWLRSINYKFDMVVLDVVDDWVYSEQWWISYFIFLGANLTNHTIGGEGLSGFRRSAETKQKISQSNKGKNVGKKHNEETKKAIGLAHKGNKYGKGYKHTEESKTKMVQSLKKRWSDPQNRLSASDKMKQIWSDDEYKKNRINNNKHIYSDPNYIKKLSQAQKTRWSDQCKQAHADKVRGQKRTKEQCDRISEAVKASYARRKNIETIL